jgi:hypothetical protein
MLKARNVEESAQCLKSAQCQTEVRNFASETNSDGCKYIVLSIGNNHLS